ncbi:uncharacterized protein SOCG_02691 [Schizosaccharomyces octosporus yFS286]|uniref:Uncharacterized protein n=1 Tax=Schizosaccharomyces octosporus (strain yFS286) TaxID=483514 RepID=S9PZT0_SCHOY|nr:uncharacterized protein SOCG_02691 [Schizosaccharomyces octosporus yFS286]EPX73467.1 hypothetical protein SOCG_02691 [Schizosaccharomyces octosporus yFS286]
MKNNYAPVSDSDDSSKLLNDKKLDIRSLDGTGTSPPYSGLAIIVLFLHVVFLSITQVYEIRRYSKVFYFIAGGSIESTLIFLFMNAGVLERLRLFCFYTVCGMGCFIILYGSHKIFFGAAMKFVGNASGDTSEPTNQRGITSKRETELQHLDKKSDEV